MGGIHRLSGRLGLVAVPDSCWFSFRRVLASTTLRVGCRGQWVGVYVGSTISAQLFPRNTSKVDVNDDCWLTDDRKQQWVGKANSHHTYIHLADGYDETTCN